MKAPIKLPRIPRLHWPRRQPAEVQQAIKESNKKKR